MTTTNIITVKIPLIEEEKLIPLTQCSLLAERNFINSCCNSKKCPFNTWLCTTAGQIKLLITHNMFAEYFSWPVTIWKIMCILEITMWSKLNFTNICAHLNMSLFLRKLNSLKVCRALCPLPCFLAAVCRVTEWLPRSLGTFKGCLYNCFSSEFIWKGFREENQEENSKHVPVWCLNTLLGGFW